jgi:hypothetical protein
MAVNSVSTFRQIDRNGNGVLEHGEVYPESPPTFSQAISEVTVDISPIMRKIERFDNLQPDGYIGDGGATGDITKTNELGFLVQYIGDYKDFEFTGEKFNYPSSLDIYFSVEDMKENIKRMLSNPGRYRSDSQLWRDYSACLRTAENQAKGNSSAPPPPTPLAAYENKTIADIYLNPEKYPDIKVSRKEYELYKMFSEIAGETRRIDSREKLARLSKNYGSRAIKVGEGTLWNIQTGLKVTRPGKEKPVSEVVIKDIMNPKKYTFNDLGTFYNIYGTYLETKK